MGEPLQPIPSKWYVYLLCNNNNVFYVGMSSDLEKRYRAHCNSEYEVSYHYISYLRLIGELPKLQIVLNTSDKYTALTCEESIIKYCILTGHKLFNHGRNTLFNTRYFPKVTKQQRKQLKRLKNIDKIVKDAKERYYATFIDAAIGRPGCLDHAERFSERIGDTSSERA